MSIEPSTFKRALGCFASGVTVVTTRGEGGADFGMTASAFSSLSLDPPLVLFCVKQGSYSHGQFDGCRGFVINLLAADQQELSTRFAGFRVGEDGTWSPWPHERSKFKGLAAQRGPASDALQIDGALASLDCTLHTRLDGGDHSIFIGHVHGARFPEDGGAPRPLLYFSGRYAGLTEEGG